MDRKHMCVANVQYKKPGATSARSAKHLLKYLTYRDSRTEGAPHIAGVERWTDHGMGKSVGELVQACHDRSSPHVLMFSLVLNPHPDLIGMVTPAQRDHFVRELTENVVEDFFEARGHDTGIEYSYVVHHRATDNAEAPGLHDPHTHVVLPGTVYSEEHGYRVPLYFSQNRKVDHIALLHGITEAHMAAQMTQYVGRDWEARYEQLEAVRASECAIVEGAPHGIGTHDNGMAYSFWCGTRRTDEGRSAVGYYRETASRDDDAIPIRKRVQFHQLVPNLTPAEAEAMAHAFGIECEGSLKQLEAFAGWVNGLSAEGRAAFLNPQQPPPQQAHSRDPHISFDIDF